MVQPLHIRGAHIWEGHKGTVQRDLYTTDVVTDQPANNALTVDLDGYTIFPGLINAHDHLELNHFPRSKFRDKYDNAHQWGEDMNARLDTEPYKSLRAYPLWDKLFIGGLKNLLCGATTVAHHNPPHKDLWRKDFPVRVLHKYGWAHSLHFSTDTEIAESYRKTPKDAPWFIHLAEGTDDIAAGEYQRLKALGCVGQNTVIVHGVGLSSEAVVDAHVTAVTMNHIGHGSQVPIVWCPTTNIYLLGKTGHPRMNWNSQTLLGSDSRLTADGDLLDEMRFVAEWYKNEQGEFMAVHCVTQNKFRWSEYWKDKVQPICDDKRADFVLIPLSENPAKLLCNSKRSELSLIVRDGVPQIGDPDVMGKFPHIQTVAATLDGRPKRIQIDLARRIHQNQLKESGLEVDELPKRKFVLW